MKLSEMLRKKRKGRESKGVGGAVGVTIGNAVNGREVQEDHFSLTEAHWMRNVTMTLD